MIPWQQATDLRPELPAGELVYSFMQANPASTFTGGESDPAAEVRTSTKRMLKKLKVRRAVLRGQARG